MGNEYDTQSTDNKKNNLELSKHKEPNFILCSNYPNDENMALEEILKDHLEEANYSFKNKENNKIIIIRKTKIH